MCGYHTRSVTPFNTLLQKNYEKHNKNDTVIYNTEQWVGYTLTIPQTPSKKNVQKGHFDARKIIIPRAFH